MLALNKPAGMLSQPDRTGDPSIIAHCHSLGWPHRLWTVHRLDRRVSGCLLLARSHKVAARLASAFRTREVVKHYLAVVHTTAAREGTMATGCYGRLRGCAAGRDLHASAAASAGASAGASAAGKSGRSVGEGVGEKGRSSDHASTLHTHSHTHSHAHSHARSHARRLLDYRVLATCERRHLALLAVSPTGGSKHQIRAMLSDAGAPIAGDARYGAPPQPTLALHAATLRLDHPVGARGQLRVLAPLPAAEWAAILPESLLSASLQAVESGEFLWDPAPHVDEFDEA